MKSISMNSFVIAFKIWVLAVVTNTVTGSLILAGLKWQFFTFALFGGFLTLVVSFPVFIIIWKILYHLFKKKYTHQEVFVALFASCILFTLLAFGLFLAFFPIENKESVTLCIATLSSVAISMLLCRSNIKNYCQKAASLNREIEQIGQSETPFQLH